MLPGLLNVQVFGSYPHVCICRICQLAYIHLPSTTDVGPQKQCVSQKEVLTSTVCYYAWLIASIHGTCILIVLTVSLTFRHRTRVTGRERSPAIVSQAAAGANRFVYFLGRRWPSPGHTKGCDTWWQTERNSFSKRMQKSGAGQSFAAFFCSLLPGIILSSLSRRHETIGNSLCEIIEPWSSHRSSLSSAEPSSFLFSFETARVITRHFAMRCVCFCLCLLPAACRYPVICSQHSVYAVISHAPLSGEGGWDTCVAEHLCTLTIPAIMVGILRTPLVSFSEFIPSRVTHV